MPPNPLRALNAPQTIRFVASILVSVMSAESGSRSRFLRAKCASTWTRIWARSAWSAGLSQPLNAAMAATNISLFSTFDPPPREGNLVRLVPMFQDQGPETVGLFPRKALFATPAVHLGNAADHRAEFPQAHAADLVRREPRRAAEGEEAVFTEPE